MERPWYKSYSKNIQHRIDSDLAGVPSVAFLLEQVFRDYADYPAFSNLGTTMSYRQINRYSLKFASYLQTKLQLKKGERIALMMPNLLQYPICFFGALRAGLIVVNINPLYTARELKVQLQDSGATTIVIFENSAHLLEEIIGETNIKNVMVTQVGDFLHFPKGYLANLYLKRSVPYWKLDGAIKLSRILKKRDDAKFVPPTLGHDDTAILQYTGGTTGVPKGAELTHRNLLANIFQVREWVRDELTWGRDIIITAIPLYHVFSLMANCLVFTSMGSLNVLITNPRDRKGFIKEMRRWKFTFITGVNSLFKNLMNAPNFRKIDFRYLRFAMAGGMSLERSVAERWKELTQIPLIEGYGLSEASPVVCISPPDLTSFNGYVGLPIPSTEIKIMKSDLREAQFGEIGEIWVRGPQVMKGYWQKPEETLATLRPDGYLKTGDLGYMTPQGFVKLVDRKKDMIIVSGFNVYPSEIEELVSKHPKVYETAVVGTRHEKFGEVVKLFVVRKDDDLTEQELFDYCRSGLTPYKMPKEIEFMASLPKSSVGKVLRRELTLH